MRAKERFAKTDARFSDALKNRRHHSDEIMIDFVFVTSAWIFLPLLTFIITNARNSSGIVVYRINPPPRPWLLLCKKVLQSFHTSGDHDGKSAIAEKPSFSSGCNYHELLLQCFFAQLETALAEIKRPSRLSK